MNGRLEHELSINKQIKALTDGMPKYVEEWNSNMEANDVTPMSRRNFVRVIKRYLTYIDNDLKTINPDMITYQSLVSYYTSIKRTIKNGDLVATSDSYQQGIWSALNNFINFMYESSYIPDNYMKRIKKPKNKDLQRINEHRILLTSNDFKKIFDAIDTNSCNACGIKYNCVDRDRAIMLLLMTTGMRKTALTEINISDINFNTNVLEIIDKGDKLQVYPLDEKVISYIKKWISKRGNIDSDALFITYQGKRMSGKAIDDVVSKYCKKALGYSVSPHKLRSGFVSIFYNKTGDIEATRRAVGHSNITTTQRYIVTDNTERKEASLMIGSAIGI